MQVEYRVGKDPRGLETLIRLIEEQVFELQIMLTLAKHIKKHWKRNPIIIRPLQGHEPFNVRVVARIGTGPSAKEETILIPSPPALVLKLLRLVGALGVAGINYVYHQLEEGTEVVLLPKD